VDFGPLAWNGAPLAVGRLVVAVLLFAHEDEIGRGLEPHVRQKGRKTAAPSLTDLDTRAAIPGVGIIRWPVTSRQQ
jgi:hypothetical protein